MVKPRPFAMLGLLPAMLEVILFLTRRLSLFNCGKKEMSIAMARLKSWLYKKIAQYYFKHAFINPTYNGFGANGREVNSG